jgi:GntR family transcriptional regulator, transcriptional repressor for pyruvate dehydrogenase complex
VTALLFDPLTVKERLSDRVAKLLLDSIVERGLLPGDRLPTERDLAVQLAVSRTVVREAVRSLAGKGIIEARPGRGLTVAAVDADMVRQSLGLFLRGSPSIDYRRMHEVRAALEEPVAGLASERATPADLERLREVCDRMEAVLYDNEAASQADVEFHRVLAAATHNELFEVLLDAAGDQLMRVRRETFVLDGRAAVALESHRRILDRVVARDAAGARREMHLHLRDVERVWERLPLKDRGKTASQDT